MLKALLFESSDPYGKAETLNHRNDCGNHVRATEGTAQSLVLGFRVQGLVVLNLRTMFTTQTLRVRGPIYGGFDSKYHSE